MKDSWDNVDFEYARKLNKAIADRQRMIDEEVKKRKVEGADGTGKKL